MGRVVLCLLACLGLSCCGGEPERLAFPRSAPAPLSGVRRSAVEPAQPQTSAVVERGAVEREPGQARPR